ncbi:DNA-binding protein [Pseudomonas sp. MOB-449]|nr:DNA-binding protein [Pseudomonas sp. MOB-449]
MNEGITERGLQLLQMASLKELAEAGKTEYVRWQNIKRGRARLGADEIEILGRVFPHFRWWLMTGEDKPEIGQISPERK